jgi:hypothetical protein
LFNPNKKTSLVQFTFALRQSKFNEAISLDCSIKWQQKTTTSVLSIFVQFVVRQTTKQQKLIMINLLSPPPKNKTFIWTSTDLANFSHHTGSSLSRAPQTVDTTDHHRETAGTVASCWCASCRFFQLFANPPRNWELQCGFPTRILNAYQGVHRGDTSYIQFYKKNNQNQQKSAKYTFSLSLSPLTLNHNKGALYIHQTVSATLPCDWPIHLESFAPHLGPIDFLHHPHSHCRVLSITLLRCLVWAHGV